MKDRIKNKLERKVDIGSPVTVWISKKTLENIKEYQKMLFAKTDNYKSRHAVIKDAVVEYIDNALAVVEVI